MAQGAIKHGTPADLANHSDGFVASGTSEFTRHAAKSQNIKLSVGKRTNGRLIRENERELRKLKWQARNEQEPTRLAKIKKNIAIKTEFIARLKGQFNEHSPATTSATGSAQQRSAARRVSEAQIITIPGAEEFDPW